MAQKTPAEKVKINDPIWGQLKKFFHITANNIFMSNKIFLCLKKSYFRVRLTRKVIKQSTLCKTEQSLKLYSDFNTFSCIKNLLLEKLNNKKRHSSEVNTFPSLIMTCKPQNNYFRNELASIYES